jgi:hypothetical protein
MKKVLIFVVSMIVFTTCDVVDSESCSDCQDALHELADKMGTNSCLPGEHANERKNIQTNCGDFGETYLGYMVEGCLKAEPHTPLCRSGVLNVSNISFQFFTSTGVADSLQIIVRFGTTRASFDFGFSGNSSIAKQFGTNCFEGDEILVVVQDALTDNELTRSTEVFTFNRPEKWAEVRGIDILHNNGTYSLDFYSW